ncbi:flagellar type III secretion system pore protein FliP [Calderihabitans maritimus]|uniref:Flagellar biosynthetic protein FliP n=1 Tax=Calderihabitans maritimus TaxID=1246530 RepID=A0A1Z5HUG9_9FIRM|nr:flagellar type III secretion system pore protein FliP [Calderihabitans maritimus]GAW92930.1 flagellar biosynthesis protein FliP [Calderihabitans maritimus]
MTGSMISRRMWLGLLVGVMVLAYARQVGAAPIPVPEIDLSIRQSNNPQEVADSLKLLVILTVLALSPAILVMMTSFTRIVVVLAFVRNALATQQTPPNQVLIGLALFLTFFTMMPVYSQIKAVAIDPYLAGEITQEEALAAGSQPLKEFMFKQTREKDLALFIKMSGGPKPQTRDEVSLTVLIPAFIISELKTAFQMGFLIYIPFLIIDMVVASTLMSMGMFMVPPVMISLPFKLLLFVMVDGWHLVVKSLLESF